MSRDKQIEEIAKDLCNSTMCDLETFNNCRMPQGNCSRCQRVAKDLYNAGYRKQSEGEWIRYPHGSGIYCSICKHKRRYRDINDAYCPNCGAKMKGGAE